MIHTKLVCEPEDCYLAAFWWPESGAVNLTSLEHPNGWALKGGTTYQFDYDDATGDVDAKELGP